MKNFSFFRVPVSRILYLIAVVLYTAILICFPFYTFAQTGSRITLVSPLNNPMTDVDINQAIIQLGGNQGEISLKGTFIINQTIKIVNNVSLIGAGMDQTVLEVADAYFVEPVISNDAPNGPDLVDVTDSDITIANLTIKGNKEFYPKDAAYLEASGVQPYGIWFTGGSGLDDNPSVKNVTIKNVKVTHIAEQGIVIENGENILVDSCAAVDVNWDGIHLSGKHLHLFNSRADSCGDCGAEIEGGQDAIVSKCSFSYDSTSGLLIRASNSVLIEDCISRHNHWRGFNIGTLANDEHCNDITMTRCMADSNGYPGIVVESAGVTEYVFLYCNTVKNNILWEGVGNVGAIDIVGLKEDNCCGELRYVIVSKNLCFNNFTGDYPRNSAIRVKNASHITVVENTCYDSRDVKKQRFGYFEDIFAAEIPDWNLICNNDFKGCMLRSPRSRGLNSHMWHNREPR